MLGMFGQASMREMSISGGVPEILFSQLTHSSDFMFGQASMILVWVCPAWNLVVVYTLVFRTALRMG